MLKQKQSQQQRLLQKLSPTQIQYMKLLQVPTAALEERIKEELEENPALEYSSDSIDLPEDKYNLDDIEPYENLDDLSLNRSDSDKIDFDTFIRSENGEDDGDYYADSDKPAPNAIWVEATFHQYLIDQLGMLDLDERRQKIAEQIIGSIDSDGYLRREVPAIVDDLAFSQNIITNQNEVKKLIIQIQHFDPPGVGAQTLQECLILQLKLEPQTTEVGLAIELLEKYFDAFIRKHYDKILKGLKIDYDQFKQVIECILKLNPKPGASFGNTASTETYIIPDFFIENNNGVLEVSLNSKNAPELQVSEGYREMMISYEKTGHKKRAHKEAVTFIKKKLDSAKWFIDSIKQRQFTLLQTMNAIVSFQHDFFLTGSETSLKPMILKDIASVTGLDISTISRVASSKYVQTEFGTFSLKYFFSDGLIMENGEEVSNKEIKSILLEIIESEDKHDPYDDEQLTDILYENGYNIARRTVAKYREQLFIPVSRMRKKA